MEAGARQHNKKPRRVHIAGWGGNAGSAQLLRMQQ